MNYRVSRVLSIASAAAMALSLTACGSSSSSSKSTAASTSGSSEEGKVLNIQAWNEEFKSRMEDHYPGYKKVDDTTGKIGDVTVKWTITPSDDNAYQNNLDSVLPNNADADADDKVDIFLMEADYALKYVNSDVTMSLKDLGITDDDLSDQFDYTKDIVKDEDGNIKGSSWQACSAGLIYNRQAAKDILGTDDPDEVQKAVADWDTFNATAAKAKEKGYKIVSTVNDTYRVYSNNVSKPWVTDGKVTVDDNIKKWVDDSKKLVDAGETTTADLWSDDWSKGFFPDGKVFCYFGPAWLINFSMHADEDGSIANQGGWGLCVGPQSFYWGGTWIAAATGTDNPTLVKDIILKMTTDQDILKEIAVDDSDCVNSKTVLDALASDSSFGNKILGGQNPYAQLEAGAEKVDMSNISPYDQGCNEEFQSAMKNYFDGNATYDEALDQFKKAIVEKYPDLTVE
ncbi:MAG: hypothetical protein LKE64_10240 [Solobacterium sp.]|jgi:hypothetical protein|nr:hypothetical protein [Solobacterium sp.]MCH4048397.1 hypothetical protein [Solobacterium sp.]MCH4074751.1 hypothetical protein [Solobacterium sp.]MCI1314612.1 hypothetical protein [Solobacterium sp.]MCI1346843.1 hypothetical protein [Solobacterium sp.]